jgi:hypothetical protein
MGAYFAVHRYIDPYALLLEAETHGATAVAAVNAMLTSRRAVAAGTLEWGFDTDIDLCLPVNATASLSALQASLDTPHQSPPGRLPVDPLLNAQPTDTCFSLQMSIPYDVEVYPYLLVKDAWDASQADAGTADRHVQCPWYFQPNVTYAVICAAPSLQTASIRFYSRNFTSLGQTPITTVADALRVYSTRGMRYLGTCGFALEHHLPSPLPTNVTLLSAPVPAPSRAPAARPSLSPATPAPSNHDDEYAVGSAPTASVTSDYYTHHDFSCLSSCGGYPGLSALQPEMTFGGCLFLLGSVFEVCSTYAIAHGLCTVPACVKWCTLRDFCYFGAAASAYCPDQPWVSAQTNSSRAARVQAQCERAYAADPVWAPHQLSNNHSTNVGAAEPSKSGSKALALPVTAIVLITAFAMFGALLLLVAVARFKLLHRGRNNAASLFRRATAAATGAHARLSSGDDATSQHGMFMNASTHSTAGASAGGGSDRGGGQPQARTVVTPLSRRMRLGLSAALRNVGVSPLSNPLNNPLSQQETDDSDSPPDSSKGAGTGVVRQLASPYDKGADRDAGATRSPLTAGAAMMSDDDDDDMQEIELSFTAPRSLMKK